MLKLNTDRASLQDAHFSVSSLLKVTSIVGAAESSSHFLNGREMFLAFRVSSRGEKLRRSPWTAELTGGATKSGCYSQQERVEL